MPALALRSAVERLHEHYSCARAFVRQTFHGPDPVVTSPVLFDPDSDEPILPRLRFVAQISSWERISEQDDGSWMNLI